MTVNVNIWDKTVFTIIGNRHSIEQVHDLNCPYIAAYQSDSSTKAIYSQLVAIYTIKLTVFRQDSFHNTHGMRPQTHTNNIYDGA